MPGLAAEETVLLGNYLCKRSSERGESVQRCVKEFD